MLHVDGVTVALGGASALETVELEVGAGERLSVVGPSGSGKTTLLRAIAGLQRPDRGTVRLGGRDLAGVPPHGRGIGLMFQDGQLFPHRDVEGNVSFGLRMDGVPAPERNRRTEQALALVGLAGFERRSIETLSGGERQRVALARALAPEPDVLLLDEPLGALDRPLRERLLGDLETVFDRLRLTVLHVTHDVGEAFALGDRVAVMHAGRIVQCAAPDELWARPLDEWVARFLGMANIRDDDGRKVVIRPEAVHVGLGEGASVVAAERRGAVVRLRVRLEDGSELDAVTTELDHPTAGERVSVEIDPAGVVELEDPSRARASGPMIRRRVIARGRVQGVFFRESTRRHAEQRGVAGWVRNNPDGTVEAVFEGTPDAVERLVELTRAGPRGAQVASVEIVEEEPEGIAGFRVG